jgi:hypothetical protein
MNWPQAFLYSVFVICAMPVVIVVVLALSGAEHEIRPIGAQKDKEPR